MNGCVPDVFLKINVGWAVPTGKGGGGMKSNVSKVLNAGFRVFRVCYLNNTITEATGGGWKKYDQLDTKAATKRAFMELMKNPKHLAL